jgi:uncharacterized membrane protein
VEPLEFLIAILGVGGVGGLLKLFLSASNKAQQASYEAIQEQRDSADKFVDRLVGEHQQTRQMIRDQEARVRDAHRRLALALMQTAATSRDVGRALDKTFDENDQ